MQQAGQPAPTASSPQLGLGQEFLHGVVRGGATTIGSLGTLLKAGGALTGSSLLAQAGEQVAQYWAGVASEYQPSEVATRSVWDDPSLVLNPHWLASSVAETLPSLAAAFIPAGAVGRAVWVGGKAIGWTPALAWKLARLGAAVTGGSIGGTLEGASTYEEVKRRGGSDDEALKAMALMGLASAGLNAISLGKMFHTAAGETVFGKAKRAAIAGVSEGLTEWLEEPTEAVILGEDWAGVMEAAKRGLNVLPAAALLGAGGNVGMTTAKEATATPAPQLAGASDAETQAPTGPQPGEPLTINLEYVLESDAVKRVLAEANRRNAERMRGDRAVKPLAQTATEAHTRFRTLEDALAFDPAVERVTDVESTALGHWRNRAAQIFEDVERRWRAGDPTATEDLDATEAVLGLLSAKREAVESIGGRLLRSMQIPSEGEKAPLSLGDIRKQEQYTGLQAQAQESTRAVVGLQREIGELKRPALGGLEREIATRRRQLETLETRQREAQGDEAAARGYREEIEALTREIEQTRPQGGQEKQLLQLEKRLVALQEKLLEVQGDRKAAAAYQEQIAEEQRAIERLQGEIATTREGLPSLRGLERKLLTAQKKHDLLMQEMSNLRDDLQAAGALSTQVEDVAELVRMMRELSDVSPEVRLARYDALKSQYQKRLAARQTISFVQAGRNALYEAWINALLSGPQTQFGVNPLSNTLTLMWSIPERAIAAQFRSGPSSVVAGEAGAMMRGLVEGFTDGLMLARQAWKLGADPTGTKLDLPKHAITAGAFGVDPAGGVGRAIDLLGVGIRWPSRLMITTDAFFKGINYRMELKALALRDATARGFTGTELVREVARLEATPPTEVQERAQEFALLNTFQNELGPGGQKMIQALNALPVLRVIFPFVKTPTNIAKWTIYRTPGLNLLSSQYRQDLATPGATRDLALARMSMGALVGASVAYLASAGLLTGGGPADRTLARDLRETGWQPYSIKVGDTFYSYNRLDPIGAVIGLVADTSEILGQLRQVDAFTLASAVTLALSKTMVNKTYMRGLSDAIDAVKNPDRGAQKYAESFARTLMPTLGRTIARVVDPTVREAQTVLESFQAVTPGWSTSLPPRRNIFGEPIVLQGGLGPDIVSPVYTTTDRPDDRVAREFVRHQIEMSMPSRVLAGRRPDTMDMQLSRRLEGVELTPQEYDRYVVLAGAGLRERLTSLILSDGYRAQTDGPDGGKALMIRQTIYAQRMAARAQMLADDQGVQARYFDYQRRRVEALVGSLER